MGDTMRVSLRWRRRGIRGATIEWLFFLAAVGVCRLGWAPCALAERPQPIFQNQFAVHIPSGRADADEIADKHGFVNMGKVSLRLL